MKNIDEISKDEEIFVLPGEVIPLDGHIQTGVSTVDLSNRIVLECYQKIYTAHTITVGDRK